jgi:hypothetical protein
VSATPLAARYASALRATLRGSRLYASLVNGSWMKKFIASVFTFRNGSTNAVDTSGRRSMSDSWICWKPRIDDPSNATPSAMVESVNDSTGTLKCCITPSRSQKRTSTE